MEDDEFSSRTTIKSLFSFDENEVKKLSDKPVDDVSGSIACNNEEIFLPMAKDGSRFDTNCCRNGFYTVGVKGEEKEFASYSKALNYLRNMPIAIWRRPNSAGKWGIVSAVSWGDSNATLVPQTVSIAPKRHDPEKNISRGSLLADSSIRPSNCQSASWLKEFLFIRRLAQGPDGRSLYQYRVEDEEYKEIPRLLKATNRERSHAIYGHYWSALFCLYIAEAYRRDYSDWSWVAFESQIGIELTPLQRSEAVKKGMPYWHRVVRVRDGGGNDYLGTLFDEGGLPWRLIQSESHGFARAIRGAIRQYYTVQQEHRDLASVVAAYTQYFPQSFQTTEKYQLIASVAEWLVSLAETHPINGLDDPAGYLDTHAPEWRLQSPLPVGEENARTLLNEWLKDANKTREEKASLVADTKNYTCEHYLHGGIDNWSIKTNVFLPGEIKIELEKSRVGSTRLELAFYEGDDLLTRAGILYGHVNDERTLISAKINQRVASLVRRHPDRPLTAHFLSNGNCIWVEYFDNSEVDYLNLPMIFVEKDDRFVLNPLNSGLIKGARAQVSVPPHLSINPNSECSVLGQDVYRATWVSIESSIVLTGDDGDFHIILSPLAPRIDISLHGELSLYRTLPNVAYRGWPKMSTSGVEISNLEFKAGGELISVSGRPLNRFGSFSCTVGSLGSGILIRRKIGVLPPDLHVAAMPATPSTPVRILVTTQYSIEATVCGAVIQQETVKTEGRIEVLLKPLLGRSLPDSLELAIRDTGSSSEPAIVRLQTPIVGAKLLDNVGVVFESRSILLDKLIETAILLTPRPDRNVNFYFVLDLIELGKTRISRHYELQINGGSHQISLFSYLEDISQMMATTNNQDAFVRLRVETEIEHMRVDIVRHNAQLDGPVDNWYKASAFGALLRSNTEMRLLGIKLSDPAAKPVMISEKSTEDVGVGSFQVPYKMMKEGPWLLVPERGSEIKFRPCLYLTNDMKEGAWLPAKTLHESARRFHPEFNSSAFSDAIQSMGDDWHNSGWEYLLTLKRKYGYLSLSAFEAWKALARDDTSLAISVFRLDMDTAFCSRLVNELAVIWEAISIANWRVAISCYKGFLIDSGIEEEFATSMLERRLIILSSSIPCFKDLSLYFLKSDLSSVRAIPLQLVLPQWYQQLRRRHADDPRWPDWYGNEFDLWLKNTDIPAEVKKLADMPYSRSVTYLPVFMAHLTAGQATLNQISSSAADIRFAARVVSDFDRDGWYEPVYSAVLSNLLSKCV
jgi:hypothetical protein